MAGSLADEQLRVFKAMLPDLPDGLSLHEYEHEWYKSSLEALALGDFDYDRRLFWELYAAINELAEDVSILSIQDLMYLGYRDLVEATDTRSLSDYMYEYFSTYENDPGIITHGRQINETNTGFTAYYDESLGRNLTIDDLIVHETRMSFSDFVSEGGTIRGHWFKDGINTDIPGVTLEACLINAELYVTNRCSLRYITIAEANPEQARWEEAIAYGFFDAYRCQFTGGSDGIKANGGDTSIIECYVRTKGQEGDHCDGIQNSGGVGFVDVIRCNIDSRPVNGIGDQTSPLFTADGATGLTRWIDSFVAGGGYSLRAHESATYYIKGMQVLAESFENGPLLYTNTPPENIEWVYGTNWVVNADGSHVYEIEFP